MTFTLTVLKCWNFTPSDLMRDYCANNRNASFQRNKYFTPYIYTDGNSYQYDHWSIAEHPENPELINVTVYLKELKQ